MSIVPEEHRRGNLQKIIRYLNITTTTAYVSRWQSPMENKMHNTIMKFA